MQSRSGDIAGDPGRDSTFAEQTDGPIGVFGCDEGDHADTHVERLFEVGLRHTAEPADETEDRLRAPG